VDKAAEMLNVSTTSTKRAAQVLKSGDEALVAAVAAGEVSSMRQRQSSSYPRQSSGRLFGRGR